MDLATERYPASHEAWQSYYKKNFTPWTGDYPKMPHDLLFRNHGQIARFPRVLVPLCGDSHDLRYLYDKGHHVQGIEICEEAIKRFFQANQDLNHRVLETEGSRTYVSQDGRLRILLADILELKSCELDYEFDAIWDRAALGSILPRHRVSYAARLKKFLKPDFCVLLAVYEHDENLAPFSVTRDDLVLLFEDAGKKAIVSERSLDSQYFDVFHYEGVPEKPFPRNIAEWLYSWSSFTGNEERKAA
jgi:thiopurine S-methyltransferase